MSKKTIYDRYKTGEIYDGKRAVWVPQPRQEEFMRRTEDEVLFGGAAGGGKSDALVIEALRQITMPWYKGLILRRTYPQLKELIGKSRQFYPQIDPKAEFNKTEHTWYFSSGAQIIFGSMNNEDAKYNYQGQAYDYIAFDELTQFTFPMYDYLRSRNRPNGPGMRCYMRASANPGGIGHGWVKEMFITPAPPMTRMLKEVVVENDDGSVETRLMSRIFVPSKVKDNPALMRNDPNYIFRMAAMSEAEKKALLYGDWDSYVGQFFSEWKNDPDHYRDHIGTHVIEPFDPPEHWRYYRSFDWGFRKPFSCGWYAVDRDGVAYRIHEFYGCKRDRPDTGVELNPSEVFAEIAKLERTHPYLRGREFIGVADPACWNRQTGKSVAQEAAEQGVPFTKGDNERVAGWIQCHERFKFGPDGRARIRIFKTCRDFIRTVPALMADEHHAEDVDTTGEDHIADEFRYFCMRNPCAPLKRPPPDPRRKNPAHTILDVPIEDL